MNNRVRYVSCEVLAKYATRRLHSSGSYIAVSLLRSATQRLLHFLIESTQSFVDSLPYIASFVARLVSSRRPTDMMKKRRSGPRRCEA